VLLAARLTAASNAAQDSIRESAEATHQETLHEDAEDEAVDAAAAAKDADASASAVADVAVKEEGASSAAADEDSDNKKKLLAPGGAKPSKDSRKESAMGKLKVPFQLRELSLLTLPYIYTSSYISWIFDFVRHSASLAYHTSTSPVSCTSIDDFRLAAWQPEASARDHS
jgi:hypothetical protein